MDDRLELRLAAEDDLAIMERLTQDPDAAGEFAWLGWHDLTRFRQRWDQTRLIDDDFGILMVVHGGERIGFVSWHKVRSTPGCHYWNIGIGLLPHARGHGHGTQAQRLLADYLFAHTAVHRIEACTEAGNVAEQRALEKAGFTREGVLRGVGWRDGQYRDGVWFGLLRTDQPHAGG
jgi:RimJ/RimL family protein N-acetyltransferase